jgi:iron complex outermembrane receptor protein
MRDTRWIYRLAVCLLIALPFSLPAYGQGEDGGDSSGGMSNGDTPVLPDTNVEADPVDPMNQPPVFDNTGLGDSPFTPPSNFPQNFPQNFVDPFASAPVDGYRAPTSTTGSIFNIPDADLPATVAVIPRDVLTDQSVLNFNEVIRNSAATFQGADGFFADRILIRGIELQSRDFRKDGFLDPTFVPRDFQNIERVEILKGPPSVLFGSSSPAGTVNLITKKPLEDEFVDFGFTFGSFNQQRYTLDANGASKCGDVMYRFNFAYEDRDGFVDFDYNRRMLAAPAVTWQISDDARITWLGEYHFDNRLGYQGVPVVGGNPLGLPPERYVGEPANDFVRTEEFRQTLIYEHEIGDDTTLQVGGSSLFYEYPLSVTNATDNLGGFAPALPQPLFYRIRNDLPVADEQSQSGMVNLLSEFDTGPLKHKFLIGMEYVYFDSDTTGTFEFLAPIDVTNPVYLDPPGTPLGGSDAPAFRQQRVGGYLQDLVEVNPYLKFLGGVRVDNVNFDYDRTITGFGQVDTEQTFDRITPRGGVVLQPFADESLAVYFNYSRSFNPPGGGIYVNTTALKPITGEIFELGMKAELMDGLSLHTAGFYITRENADLNVGSFFLAQVGEERSQGFETSLVGEITEWWSILGNYSYTDVRLSDPFDPTFDDSRQRNVPYNASSIWSRINLIDNEETTLGFAAGWVYVGSRPGDLANTFDLPHYNRWDGGLYLRHGHVRAELYAENIFDVQYARSSIDAFQVYQGAPANLRGTIGITY